MVKQISVTIVGPGSFGTALARALHEGEVRVAEIVHRGGESGRRAKRLAAEIGAEPVAFAEAEFKGKVIWLCVSDSAIASIAVDMANRRPWNQTTIFHSSGALSSDELAPLRRRGAKAASVHPMMTFVRNSVPSMRAIPFALEGDRAATATARKLVKKLGGGSFVMAKKDKPLYHALGAFVSPLVIALMSAAECIGRELGLRPQQTRNIIAPILQQTIRNYIVHGPAAAFSGPIVRGDAETVRKNLLALKRVRGAAEIYRALTRIAIEELPSKDARAIVKVLKTR